MNPSVAPHQQDFVYSKYTKESSFYTVSETCEDCGNHTASDYGNAPPIRKLCSVCCDIVVAFM